MGGVVRWALTADALGPPTHRVACPTSGALCRHKRCYSLPFVTVPYAAKVRESQLERAMGQEEFQ
jgi:hypothetical protein